MHSTRVARVLDALKLHVEDVRGRRAWIRCVFHQDKTATNFFVRLEGSYAGTFHCFSCKVKGNLIDLTKQVKNYDYENAKKFVETLGKNAEPEKRRVTIAEPPPKLTRSVFKIPKDIYFEPMEEWVSGARRYAQNRCKITPEEVTLFRIGYAVDGRLAGRIVLPWIDERGVFGGYSARTWCDEEPKYKTPHEDDLPDATIMFGEHTWSHEKKFIVVTEGALNVMAIRRALAEYRFDIAAMGGSDVESTLFPQRVTKLALFKNVIVMTDSDSAGDNAAMALRRTLRRYVHIERPRLPDDKDALDVGVENVRQLLQPLFASLGVDRAA